MFEFNKKGGKSMDENMENNTQNLENQPNNGLAIAGFVVGLVSIFLNFYCITGIVGLILSILGLKKSKETGKSKSLAIAGIICSIIGIIVGSAFTSVIGTAIGIKCTPTISAVLISFSVSVGIGLIFGYMPASRAAKLNPIDALRSE